MSSTKENSRHVIIGYFCAIGASLFWGFHSVIIRILISDGVDPFLIASLRLFIGSALLSIIVALWSVAKRSGYPRVRYSPFFWLISVCLGINFLLFQKGLEFTIASDAVLLEAFSPVMVLIIVMLFFPKRINHLLIHPGIAKKILYTVIIGSIGSSLLLINDPKELVISHNLKLIGDIIQFIAMILWAVVMLSMHEYQKREPGSNIVAATAQFLLCAALITAPFSRWSEISSLTTTQWGWILVFGIFSTAGAYILWHIASKYLDVLPLITIFNLTSIFTIITESLVLGLRISWQLFLGGAFILYAATRAKRINAKYKILEKGEMGGE